MHLQFWIQPGVFLISSPFFHGCNHPFLSYICHFNRTFFSGDFFVCNHTGIRKKIIENWVSKWFDFISREYIFQSIFFHRTFLVPKFRTLFPKTFFQRTFLAVTTAVHLLHCSIYTLYCTAVFLHCIVPQYIYIVLHRSTFTMYCTAVYLHCTVP